MKKSDVEKVIKVLNDIKDYTKTMDFKTSTFINQQVIQALPILEQEYQRLDTGKTEINCPKLLVLGQSDIVGTGYTLIDFANIQMAELVENGYKIIDFGLYNNCTDHMHIFIKYTD